MAKITRITVDLLLIAILLPIAITQFTSVSTTGWDTTLSTVWKIIPVLAILGIALDFLTAFRKK